MQISDINMKLKFNSNAPESAELASDLECVGTNFPVYGGSS